jgi:hypothetical protein
VLASIGLIKRGVPMIPSEIDPPCRGTVTIKDLFILSIMSNVLNIKIIKSPANTYHSFLEKEEKTEFISFFVGNFK